MRTILTSSSLLALGAWAPALVAAAAFQPTPAIGEGVFQALTRLGPTATPFCLSLLDLPRAITKTETFTPTEYVPDIPLRIPSPYKPPHKTNTPSTIYVVVSTATVFDSSCITDAPIVPRAVAGEPNNLGQPGKYKPHFGKPGNYGQSGFDGILGDLLPKGLLPFPAGLISKACSELGRDVFPWKTTQTVFETAPADVS